MAISELPRRGLLGVLALALCSGGCALPNETIEGSDRSTLFAGLRSSWRLGDQSPGNERPGRVQTLFDLDLITSGSGFTQQVPPGHAVGVGGVQFVGPAEVDVAFDVVRLSADVRASARAESGLGVEGFAGLGYHELDLRLTSMAQRKSQRFSGVGPLLGLAFFYEPAEWVHLFAEGSVNPAVTAGAASLIDFNTLELGARFRLGEHVALGLSWRETSYRAENDPLTSNLDLTASGPAFLLAFSW